MTKKKWLAGLLCTFLMTFLLQGCVDESKSKKEEDTYEIKVEDKEEKDERFNYKRIHTEPDDLYVLIDKDTNVQYLQAHYDHSGSMIPILNVDGTLFVGASVDKNRFTFKKLRTMGYLLIDNETKINYYGFKGHIMPLLNPDGSINTSKIVEDIKALKEKIKDDSKTDQQ